jgi:hypothetical protein
MPVALSQANRRPRAVHTAVTILWVGLGIGILNSLFVSTLSNSSGAHAVQFVVVGVMAVIIAMISRGSNGARITFLVLYLLGLISMVVTFPLLLRVTSSRSLLLQLTGSVLQTVAMILLFQREASEWFRAQH